MRTDAKIKLSFRRTLMPFLTFGAAVLLCAGCWAPAVRGQQPQPTPEATRPRRVTTPPPADDEQTDAAAQGDPDEVLRVETDLVLFDATVTDAEGRVVRDLRAQDFRIYVDEVERPVAFFNVERRGGAPRPVAVVFALDVSGSVTREELGRLRDAVRAFARALGGERASVFAVMTFGMSAKVLQTLTSDPQKLDRAFDRLEGEAGGLSTHTYDAVDDAVRLLARKAPRTRERRLLKRAVVVITDGFPVGDTVSAPTVIERANAAEVSVYTVTLPSYSRVASLAARRPLPTPLDVSGLAERTGGTNVYATDADFAPLFRALAEEVTSTYVLAFYPTDEIKRDGRYHSVRIEAPPGYVVRQGRPGYRAPGK